MSEKRCTQCKRLLPTSEFWKHRSRRDGLASQCKACGNAARKKLYAADSERFLAPQRKRRNTDAEYRERDNARRRGYRREHREAELATSRQYLAEHREQNRRACREYQNANRDALNARGRKRYAETHEARRKEYRDWCNANPGKRQLYYSKRRAQRIGNGGEYTIEEWHELCERCDNRCLCCGEVKPLTVDHIIPVSQGGTSNIDNIQPLCLSCNSRKGAEIANYRTVLV